MRNLLIATKDEPVGVAIGAILVLAGLAAIAIPGLPPVVEKSGAVSLALGTLQLSLLIARARTDEQALAQLRPRLDPLCGRLGAVSGQLRQAISNLSEEAITRDTAVALLGQAIATLAGIINDLQLLTGTRFDRQALLDTLDAIERYGRELEGASTTKEELLETDDAERAVRPEMDYFQSLLRQVRSSLKAVEEPFRPTAVVEVNCPTCGTPEKVPLGLAQGDSALPTCPSCGRRYHVHRGRDRGVSVREWGGGPEAPPIVHSVPCPNCGKYVFKVKVSTGGDAKAWYCLECHAKILLTPANPTVIAAPTKPLIATLSPDGTTLRHILLCPTCTITSPSFVLYNDACYAECRSCHSLLRHEHEGLEQDA